jgi:hypothetical protein
MKREPLAEAGAAELLAEILATLREISRKLDQRPPRTGLAAAHLLQAIHRVNIPRQSRGP